MGKQSTKDNLIKLFISKFENSNTNEISIYKSDIEELGISDEVVNATNIIFNRIIDEYKHKKYESIVPHGVGIYEYQGYFIQENIFGHYIY